MNFLPYVRHTITPADELAVRRVMHSDYLTQGPEVEAFETDLAAFAGAKYAVACSSGTAALHLAYAAAEWGPGDTIALPAVSFVATANALEAVGAKPVFYDNTDREKPDGGGPIVGVTLGGDPLTWTPDILDACHGPLRHAATLATCFSFHPAKHVAGGEGGAVVTNSPGFAAQMRSLADHGRNGKDRRCFFAGYNYRMDEMTAALCRSQLSRYAAGVEIRRDIAARYDAAFKNRVAVWPHSPESARHLYQILVNDRAQKQHGLRLREIGSQVHYTPIIPLQPFYALKYGFKSGMLPLAEVYADTVLSIPLYPTLIEQDMGRVVSAVLEVCG
jgi:perosamine synthetase